jgi:hypothetical protein
MTHNSSRRFLQRTLAVVSMTALLAACGRGEEQPSPAPAPKAAEKPAAAAMAPAKADDPDSRLATAVATGKTSAGVDLKYDVAAKPAPGQDFQIELVFLPRVAADVLEVEVTPIPGITLVSGATARFENVTAGERYTAPVVARAEGQGLYYLGVAARMATKVQTEARTFSVPVVVGDAVAAQKPEQAPAQDASGQVIESLPAEESGRETR